MFKVGQLVSSTTSSHCRTWGTINEGTKGIVISRAPGLAYVIWLSKEASGTWPMRPSHIRPMEMPRKLLEASREAL